MSSRKLLHGRYNTAQIGCHGRTLRRAGIAMLLLLILYAGLTLNLFYTFLLASPSDRMPSEDTVFHGKPGVYYWQASTGTGHLYGRVEDVPTETTRQKASWVIVMASAGEAYLPVALQNTQHYAKKHGTSA